MKANNTKSKRRWNRKGLPHKGWRCKDVYDLEAEQGDDYAPEVCEMCGKEGLRYIHVMSHPKCKKRKKVGCVCAGKMMNDRDTPYWHERRLFNRSERLKR